MSVKTEDEVIALGSDLGLSRVEEGAFDDVRSSRTLPKACFARRFLASAVNVAAGSLSRAAGGSALAKECLRITEWRDPDCETEAEIEVLAKLSFLNAGLKVAIGGCHETDSDLPLASSADQRLSFSGCYLQEARFVRLSNGGGWCP